MNTIELLDFNNLSFEQLQDLEKVTIEMQNDYNQLIEEISKKQTIGSLWWITSIPSRNIYQSPLFTHCAHLSLILYYFEKGCIIKHINCTNKNMKNIIIKFISDSKYDIKVTYSKRKLKKHLKNVVLFIYWALYTISMMYCTIRFKNKLHICENKNLILIDTFTIDSTVNKKFGYKERYFNGMLDCFTEKEKENIFMFPSNTFSLKNYIKNYKLLMNIKSPQFLTNESLIKIEDYFSGWHFLIKVFLHSYRTIYFQGFSIEKLLNTESAAVLINHTTFSSFLRYKAIFRMKEKEMKVRLLLDWFEGQAIDKATYYGFNIFFPDTTTIAYNGMPGELKAHPYAIPTKLETENHMSPKFLAVMGKAVMSSMQRFGTSVPIIVAPAFRAKHVWEREVDIGRRVIVTLPLDKDLRNQVLELVLEVIEFFQKTEIVIKKHPTDNSSYAYLSNNHSNIICSEAPFHLLVEDCALLISGASTTCLETIAMGIPLIVIGDRHKITAHPIADTIPKDIWELCYNKEELIVAIQRFLNLRPQDFPLLKNIGNKVKEDYLEKTEKGTVRKLLTAT